MLLPLEPADVVAALGACLEETLVAVAEVAAVVVLLLLLLLS